MSTRTLPLLTAPSFPQVLPQTLNSFVTRVIEHPLLQLRDCDYSDEYCVCKKFAVVSWLGHESEFCLDHFRKVAGREAGGTYV